MKIIVTPFDKQHNNSFAYYSPSRNAIFIRSDLDTSFNDDLKNTLIHEVQHAIQRIEGFAPGGKPVIFEAAYKNFNRRLDRQRKKLIELDKDIGLNNFLYKNFTWEELNDNSNEKREERSLAIKKFRMASSYANEYKKIYDKIDSLIKEQAEKHKGAILPQHIYAILGGEVEARNVEMRRNMSEEERRTTPLADTQATDQWILPDENGQYNQVLGEVGARALDKRNGNTHLIDGLNMAKEMTKTEVDAKTIKAVTNWEKAPDGKWRYEIMDYDIDEDNLRKAMSKNDVPFNMELADLYDNEELFNAYPYMRRYTVRFTALDNSDGYYDDDNHLIAINVGLSPSEVGSVLLHEVQHAIQDIEGFARGGNPEEFADDVLSLEKLERELKSLEKRREKAIDEDKRHHLDERIAKLKARIYEIDHLALDGWVEVDGKNYVDETDAYRHLGGEVEAYNVEKRKDFTEQQRRNTLLSETQDYEDWIIRHNYSLAGKTASQKRELYNDSNFMTDEEVEEYDQRIIKVFEGTGHIIEGNEFRLDKIGTGEGHAAFAWGAYLAENKAVAQTYREFGLDRQPTIPGKFSITDKDGKVHEFEVMNGRVTIPDGQYSDATRRNLTNLATLMRSHPKSTFKAIKSRLRRYYKDNVKDTFAWGKDVTQSMAESLKELEEGKFVNATFTDSISDNRKGNIYKFAIADNDDLLDWDKPFKEQPKIVQRAMRRIYKDLIGNTVGGLIERDPESSNMTGEEFYNRLTVSMEYFTYLDFFSAEGTPFSFTRGEKNPQKLASMALNRYGVPGTRFLDRFSRLEGKGTHNYVIWNMKRLKMTGITKDSDKDARDFFKNGGSPQYRLFDDNGEPMVYNQIAPRRKADMDLSLRKHRPDMSEQQRADAISEIEKLGESTRQGGNPKVEKIATKWLLDGHIILPEDNYKVLDAIKISEQQHFDPMQYDDPNKILAKYTIKQTKTEMRINPDAVPEFSDKVEYDHGITVYTVDDTEDGQSAVRSIIDTHWGEDANPWCLAARQAGNLSKAWGMWKKYSGTPKRIAFQNGKLLAFSASNSDKVLWWDREDNSTSGIPITTKSHGNTTVYSYDVSTGTLVKASETLSDGTKRWFHENGSKKSEKLPDGTKREWYDNGQLRHETLPDNTRREWFENGQLRSELSAWISQHFYKNGQLHIKNDYKNNISLNIMKISQTAHNVLFMKTDNYVTKHSLTAQGVVTIRTVR